MQYHPRFVSGELPLLEHSQGTDDVSERVPNSSCNLSAAVAVGGHRFRRPISNGQ